MPVAKIHRCNYQLSAVIRCRSTPPPAPAEAVWNRFDLLHSLDVREGRMKRFIEGDNKKQGTLFPDCLEDFVHEDSPVCAVGAFVDANRS